MSSPAWHVLGGEEGVAPLVNRLVDRAANDIMIGFFFKGVDLERVKRHELELASAHLGGPAAYAGRPIPEAHRKHQISRGQFSRRLKILEEVLREAGVQDAIREQWLAHDRSLERSVVQGECNA